MGRPWREEHTGGIYHVIARGNNKEYIFHESIDKGYFVKILKECRVSMGCILCGFVLMDNHYHLLIQITDKKLQEIMHLINNKYSKYFNLKYERVGHVFQGRYKSSIVQDERYMLTVLRYIHQNPVKAHMCKRTEEYKWSSDVYYRKSIKGLVDTSLILDMLDSDRNKALRQYILFMEEDDDTDYDTKKIVGDEAYQVLCSSKNRIVSRKRLDEILFDIGVSKEVYDLIKAGSRRRDLTKSKVEYIRTAVEYKYTFKEIGMNIKISESGVQKLLERYE